MPLLGTVAGWSAFGLAARCWQLGIQRRNIFDNLGGHALSIGFWGTVGYFYYGWEGRVQEMLELKKQDLRDVRAIGASKKQPAGGSEDEE